MLINANVVPTNFMFCRNFGFNPSISSPFHSHCQRDTSHSKWLNSRREANVSIISHMTWWNFSNLPFIWFAMTYTSDKQRFAQNMDVCHEREWWQRSRKCVIVDYARASKYSDVRVRIFGRRRGRRKKKCREEKSRRIRRAEKCAGWKHKMDYACWMHIITVIHLIPSRRTLTAHCVSLSRHLALSVVTTSHTRTRRASFLCNFDFIK